MHQLLRKLLPDAVGESSFVVAIFLDVRGFSKFAGMAESVEAAVYLKKTYIKIIGEYLTEPDFFKPTVSWCCITMTNRPSPRSPRRRCNKAVV